MRLRTLLLSLLSAVGCLLHADTISDVDSLLRVYGESRGSQRLEAAGS